MIYVGIDDTDIIDSPGTNQLARHMAEQLSGQFETLLIARHQLLDDPQVPYTSQNGSASLLLEPRGAARLEELITTLRRLTVAWAPEGSDPGLCVATTVPPAISEWGRRCQRDLVEQGDARRLAAEAGIYLQGLGGTQGGVIGALAAVGLVATGDDGRLLRFGPASEDWYDVSGWQSVERLHALGIAEIRCLEAGSPVSAGEVDVGKRLRANLRGGKAVLYVEPVSAASAGCWQALRIR